MSVTFKDMFCGAGGSSLGAEEAGAQCEVAMNHWQPAIDTHRNWFPNARHDLADISQADPRRYPRTDVLIASPECTNHSQSRGVSRKRQNPTLWDAPDPAAERSRATMWDVVRFAEQMDYAAVVVENVVEVSAWVLFPSWWTSMESLGYIGTVLSRNSMFHRVPQSRDRVFIVWLKKGLRVDFGIESEAWCERCESDVAARQCFRNGHRHGRYGSTRQWVWGCPICGTVCKPAVPPALPIIDWSLSIPRIGERKELGLKPLVPNTRARVLAGLQRHGWAPVLTSKSGNTYETTPGNRARTLDRPLPTQQTSRTTGIATPPGFSPEAMIVPWRKHGAGRTLDQPIPTVAANGRHHALVMRNNSGGGEMLTPVTEPFRTITTGMKVQSIVMPDTGATELELERIIDQCGLRGLEPFEAARGMGFPENYISRQLTTTDQQRLAGNAVTPPVMADLMRPIIAALEAAA